jgi:hypothetical protein
LLDANYCDDDTAGGRRHSMLNGAVANRLLGDAWPAGEARAGSVEISMQRQRQQ